MDQESRERRREAMEPSGSEPLQNPITRLAAANGFPVIIDGALATELERRGCDVSSSLWSCQTLLESPDKIQQVHQDYFEAGAHVAITASYQASVPGLKEHKGMDREEAMQLIGKSVQLAREARRQVASRGERSEADMLVAGSVGPYGAYLADGSEYRGDYGNRVSTQEFKDFHRPRIQALLEAGADLLACETMPSLAEVEALSNLLQEEFPQAQAWFSLTVKDSRHMSDGSEIARACHVLEQNRHVVAVGANCISRDLTLAIIEAFKSSTSLPIVVYPNSGETWDAEQRRWTSRPSAVGQSWADCVQEWSDAGAAAIGGCCRTGPNDIRITRETLARKHKTQNRVDCKGW